MNTTQQQFASDNYAGTCPEALQALLDANASGHEPAYGELALVSPDGQIVHHLDWQFEQAVTLLKNVLLMSITSLSNQTQNLLKLAQLRKPLKLLRRKRLLR